MCISLSSWSLVSSCSWVCFLQLSIQTSKSDSYKRLKRATQKEITSYLSILRSSVKAKVIWENIKLIKCLYYCVLYQLIRRSILKKWLTEKSNRNKVIFSSDISMDQTYKNLNWYGAIRFLLSLRQVISSISKKWMFYLMQFNISDFQKGTEDQLTLPSLIMKINMTIMMMKMILMSSLKT